MILLWGTRHLLDEKIGTMPISCPKCQNNDSHVIIARKFAHLWFFPIIPLERDIVLRCTNCGHEFGLARKEDQIAMVSNLRGKRNANTLSESMKGTKNRSIKIWLGSWTALFLVFMLLVGLIMGGTALSSSSNAKNNYPLMNTIPENWKEIQRTEKVALAHEGISNLIHEESLSTAKQVKEIKEICKDDLECRYAYSVFFTSETEQVSENNSVQEPETTIQTKKGDLEDNAVLALKMLTDLGLDGALFFDGNIVYPVVCGIDFRKHYLNWVFPRALERQEIRKEDTKEFNIPAKGTIIVPVFEDGNLDEFYTIKTNFEFNQVVSVKIEGYEGSFQQYCGKENSMQGEFECFLQPSGTEIEIKNESGKQAEGNIIFQYAVHTLNAKKAEQESEKMMKLEYKEKNCLIYNPFEESGLGECRKAFEEASEEAIILRVI